MSCPCQNDINSLNSALDKISSRLNLISGSSIQNYLNFTKIQSTQSNTTQTQQNPSVDDTAITNSSLSNLLTIGNNLITINNDTKKIAFNGNLSNDLFTSYGNANISGNIIIQNEANIYSIKSSSFLSKYTNTTLPLYGVPQRDFITTNSFTTYPTPNQSYEGVCWSPQLGLFAAVSTNGAGSAVMTSPDGITWTLQTTPINNGWNSICWSPELGLFVAVAWSGSNDRVMTSSDGITWTLRSTPTNNNFWGVCWAPELGLFCAVSATGSANRAMISSDGINWTSSTTPDKSWTSVCWSSELKMFCAVASPTTSNNNLVMTSYDGINWTSQVSPANNNWESVCWSPQLGIFCAVGGTGTNNRVMTSPDGVNWTLRTNPVDNYWLSVIWAPEISLFTAVSTSGSSNRIMTSPDGINWTSRTSQNNTWTSISWSPQLGIFCAVSTDATNLSMVSQSMYTYSSNVYGNINNINTFFNIRSNNSSNILTYNGGNTGINNAYPLNGNLVINGNVSVGWGYGNTLYSTSNQVPLVTMNGRSLWKITGRYFGGTDAKLYFDSNYGNTFIISSNSILSYNSAFTFYTAPDRNWKDFVEGANILVAVGRTSTNATNLAMTSTNGTTWTQRTTPSNNTWRTVVWSSSLNLFVAIAEQTAGTNNIMTSPDGATWTARTTSVSDTWNALAWSPTLGLFAAMGTSTNVITSTNGTTWTNTTITKTQRPIAMIWVNELNLFITIFTSTVSPSNIVMTSSNGTTWNTVTLPSSVTQLTNIAWSSDLQLLCAVSDIDIGSTQQVVTSPDGINWTLQSTPLPIRAWSGITWSPKHQLFFISPTGSAGSYYMTSPNGIDWTLRDITGGISTLNRWSIKYVSFLNTVITIAGSATGNNISYLVDYTDPTYSHVAEYLLGDGSANVGLISYGNSIVNNGNITLGNAITLNGNILIGSNIYNGNSRVLINKTSNIISLFQNNSIQKIEVTGNANIYGNVFINGQSNIYSLYSHQLYNPYYGTNTLKVGTPQRNYITNNEWLRRSTPNNNAYWGIDWSPQLGLFAAVSITGTGNRVMTSPDGINWTARTSASDVNWNSVHWVPDLSLFVAVGSGIMTSPDGITWTLRTSPITGLTDFAWSPKLKLLVAVANSGTNRCISSNDGITWSIVTINSNTWYRIVWSQEVGIFVAISDGTVSVTNRIAYSYDGTNWNYVNAPANYSYRGLVYASNLRLFIASSISNVGSEIMTSVDGITWTIRSTPTVSDLQNITYSPQLNLVLGLSGANAIYSSDGINWSSYTHGYSSSATWRNICWCGELGVFVGVNSDTTLSSQVLTSKSMWNCPLNIYLNSYNATSNLNVDDKTLFVDSVNNRVGILTATPAYELEVNGSAGKTGGGTWSAPSDMRIKKNIENANLDICVENIESLKLKYFKWSNIIGYDKDIHSLGWIAQDVKNIYPNAISLVEKYGFSDFHYIDSDLIWKCMYGSVKKLINDKEDLEKRAQEIQTFLQNL